MNFGFKNHFVVISASCMSASLTLGENKGSIRRFSGAKTVIACRRRNDFNERRCKHATDHATKNGRKNWKYLLIAHDIIAENMTLRGLAAQSLVQS